MLSRSFDDGTAEGEAAAAQFERLSRAVSTIIAVEYHGRAAELQARYERLDPRGVHAQRNFRRETAERTAATERGETPPPPPQRSAAQAAEAAAFSAALHTTMREASRSASLRPFLDMLSGTATCARFRPGSGSAPPASGGSPCSDRSHSP